MKELDIFRQYLTEARYNKATMDTIVDFAMKYTEDEDAIDGLRHYKYQSYSELIKELIKQIESRHHSSFIKAVNKKFNVDYKLK